MKQTPKQIQQTQVAMKALRSQFASLRQQTGSLNETERLNLVRVKLGLKPVRTR